MAKYDIEHVAFDVDGARIGIAAARFNQDIVDRLLDGAVQTLGTHGIAECEITTVRVPGAFELPIAAGYLIEYCGCDAVIVLGVVIRGETPHFDYVAAESARGVMAVGLENGVPTIFGVLTTDNADQARERAGGTHGNKGTQAARAALEMISLRRHLHG